MEERQTTMKKVGLLLLALAATPAAARAGDERCIYGGNFYGPGAVRCNQAGSQERCVAGTWKALGIDCADEDAGPAGMPEEPGVGDDAVNARPRPTIPAVTEPSLGR